MNVMKINAGVTVIIAHQKGVIMALLREMLEFH